MRKLEAEKNAKKQEKIRKAQEKADKRLAEQKKAEELRKLQEEEKAKKQQKVVKAKQAKCFNKKKKRTNIYWSSIMNHNLSVCSFLYCLWYKAYNIKLTILTVLGASLVA